MASTSSARPESLTQAGSDHEEAYDAVPVSVPSRRPLIAAAVLLTTCVAASALLSLNSPKATRRSPTALSLAAAKASTPDADPMVFSAPFQGKGCKNWAAIMLLNLTASSAEECGKMCANTAGCHGMGVSTGAPGCGGSPDKPTCLLWMDKCEEEDNPCFDDYAVDSSAPAGCPRKKPGDKYTVMVLFGGRRDRMSVLIGWVDKLVDACVLDEVHIWDFTRDDHDATWLGKVTTERPVYKLIQPTKDDWWNPAYHYYANWGSADADKFTPRWSGAAGENTVLVKLDDDMVYLNVPTFSAFTDYVVKQQDEFLVHANVINNGVAAYYQALHIERLARRFPELLEYPTDEFDELREDGDPITPGRYGALLRNSEIALGVHQDFMSNMDDYSWNDETAGPCIEFKMPGSAPEAGQGRFSINFFGVTWASWKRVDKLVSDDFASNPYAEDEQILTKGATEQGLKECMFTPFTVAHLSFGCQKIPDSILEKYRDILIADSAAPDAGAVQLGV